MFKKTLLKVSYSFLGIVIALLAVGLLSPNKASAAAINHKNGTDITYGSIGAIGCNQPVPNDWAVGGRVYVRLFDEAGNFAGYAKKYTFNVTSNNVAIGHDVDPAQRDPNQDNLGSNWTLTKDDSNETPNPSDFFGGCHPTPGEILFGAPDVPAHPYIFDSGYVNGTNPTPNGWPGTDRMSLDCLNGGSEFTFSGASVQDAGWQYGYWTIANHPETSSWTVGIGTGDRDLNDWSISVTMDFHRTAPPKSTISTQKYYPPDHYPDVNAAPAIPAAVAGAKVYYGNNDAAYDGNGDDGFDRGTSNPFVNNNIWLNPSSPTSSTPGDYKVWVEVPTGYKVTGGAIDVIGQGRNNSPPIACGVWSYNGKNICTITGVRVNPSMQNGGITYVDFFFARDIRGSLDQACGINQAGVKQANVHTITGWTYDPSIPNNHPSFVDIKVYDNNDQQVDGWRVLANSPRPDVQAAGQTPDPNHGFVKDIDQKYFDAKLYKVRAFPLVPINSGGNLDDPNNWQGSGVTLGPLNFRCPGSTGNIDQACVNNNILTGWGVDGQDEAKSPTFHIYIDGKFATAITADTARPDVVAFLNNQAYPGPLEPGGKYGFNIQDLSKVLPSNVQDGNPHTMTVYLITKDGSNPSLYTGPAGAQTNVFPCSPKPQLRPWLQTYNGDVIANGQAINQPAGQPGSRALSNTDEEAEYLVISAVGGAGPFCSTTNYVLTNPQALSGNSNSCQNGSGYRINSQGLGGSGADKILAAINKAWVSNGSGNAAGGNTKCSPYNTQVSTNLEGGSSTSPVPLATGYGAGSCINGTIIKLNGNHLGNVRVDSGRITIWVTADQIAASGGTLTIDNNIVYNYSPGYDDARKVPNLAIIVDGNVNIDSNNILSGAGVSQLDAAIYATGTINTCSQFSSVVITSPTNCNKGLIVHGMLAGRNGFKFNRTFDNNGSNPPPAEQIILTGQTVAFPPPGLDNLYFGDFDSASQIDTGELQPRF